MSNLILNAGIFSWLGDWFYGLWVNLMLLIDNVIYIFINWLYRIFMLVAEVDIFKDGTQLEAIAKRLYLIVGIAMLFIFAYNLILLIVNPEGKRVGDMGKLVQRAILSVILVTLLPSMFSLLSSIQTHILQSNVIGHVILGTSSGDEAVSTKKAGVDTALTIFSAFYHPEGQSLQSCIQTPNAHKLCSVYTKAFEDAYNNESISDFIWNSKLKEGAKKGEMEYNWIISTAAGIWALWCFISFALDVGVRVGKLAFYEVISPIPVMMRILPNDKKFETWKDGLVDTYLSLFVRLAVIYFCMYAITLVPDILTNMWAKSGDGWLLLALANVIVILGILQFAKEAPKLLSELFKGKGEGLKFGIKDKYKSAAAPLGRVADVARSGVYGATTADSGGWNRFKGFMGGATRGARYGYDRGTQRLNEMREANENGSTLRGRMQDRALRAVGAPTRYDMSGANEEKQLKKERIEEREKHNNSFKDAVDKFGAVAEKVVTASNSQYRSSAGVYEKTIAGRTYSLDNKNLFEMQEVIADAERNNVDASEIIKMKNIMEKHKKDQIKAVKDQQLRVGTINASSSLQEEIKKAQALISETIKDGAAETVDANGNLVSHVSDADLANANALKAAVDRVNDSIDIINQTRRDITRRDAGYKARKADSDYVKNNEKKGDK